MAARHQRYYTKSPKTAAPYRASQVTYQFVDDDDVDAFADSIDDEAPSGVELIGFKEPRKVIVEVGSYKKDVDDLARALGGKRA